jgi:PKD repeat protein
VAHTYVSAGTDTVTLIVSGPLGASTNARLGYITVTNIPSQLSVTPVSHDFGFLPVGQTSTQTFSVINGGSLALTGTVTFSGTSFGLVNGSPFNVSGRQTGLVNVSFGPGSAASFTGSVVFTSNGGVSTNAVTGAGAVAPVANFTASPTNGAASLIVAFTDTSTGTITNHSWTFGDGGTSTSNSPSHTYTNAGTFSVSLTVLGPLGSSTTNRVNLITATNAPPLANFTASPTNGAAPLNVTFTDTSTGTVTNHSWTFGDGGTSTSSSPSHSYTNAGTFSVSLTVLGPLGSSTTNRVNLITVTNGVNTPPTVSIVRPATGMLYPIAFTNETITIVANASSGAGISLIEFFVDAVKLGQTNANPGSILWNMKTAGAHTLTAVAHDTLGATNISSPVVVTIGAKNSPLGDWEVKISGADKGVEFLTFEDDFSASGFGIRLKTFGLDDVSGTWGFDAKGRLTGSFIEQLGSATNWTGTLAGTAKSLKSLSASVTTTTVGVFRWKGVPATTSPDLSGTWTGVVTIVKAPTSVSYAIRTNATDSAVFDVTTTLNTNAVIGQLIATSRDVVYGYVTTGGTNITMSGKFNSKKLPMTMTFKGTDTTADKVSIKLSQ